MLKFQFHVPCQVLPLKHTSIKFAPQMHLKRGHPKQALTRRAQEAVLPVSTTAFAALARFAA